MDAATTVARTIHENSIIIQPDDRECLRLFIDEPCDDPYVAIETWRKGDDGETCLTPQAINIGLDYWPDFMGGSTGN